MIKNKDKNVVLIIGWVKGDRNVSEQLDRAV